jgi:hypothetical protein
MRGSYVSVSFAGQWHCGTGIAYSKMFRRSHEDINTGKEAAMKHIQRCKVHFLLLILSCVAAVLMGTGSAEAFNPADLAKLKATRVCPNCDLHWANLNGAIWPNGATCKQDSIGACKK